MPFHCLHALQFLYLLVCPQGLSCCLPVEVVELPPQNGREERAWSHVGFKTPKSKSNGTKRMEIVTGGTHGWQACL